MIRSGKRYRFCRGCTQCPAEASGVLVLCRRVRKLHFQLQVTIGSYGYEPLELYLVHGVLAFLALVVAQCVLTEVHRQTFFMPGGQLHWPHARLVTCSLRTEQRTDWVTISLCEGFLAAEKAQSTRHIDLTSGCTLWKKKPMLVAVCR